MDVELACQNDRPAQQTGKLQKLGRHPQAGDRPTMLEATVASFSRFTGYEFPPRRRASIRFEMVDWHVGCWLVASRDLQRSR